MIKQVTESITYTEEEQQYLDSLKPYNAGLWDKGYENLKQVKNSIRQQLENIFEGECSYCGNLLHVTSPSEIEHIAPKGITRNTKFMFTEYNLGIACHYCNGFSKKGTKDTVSEYNDEYNKCVFKIVHPYFDNPDEHYDWVDENLHRLIQAKTEKGRNSIRMFELDDPHQSVARAKDIIYEQKKLSQEKEKVIENIQSTN